MFRKVHSHPLSPVLAQCTHTHTQYTHENDHLTHYLGPLDAV